MLTKPSLAALALSVALAVPYSAVAQPSGDAPQALPVGTCVNMGNSLEPPTENGWGGEPIAAEDFARIKAAGFDTIRLPVRWHARSRSEAPYTVDPEWMTRVRQIVDWALDADLNVILNSHHFDPIHVDPAGTAQWHGGVWRQIAVQFADYPEDRLWFELENEPHMNFNHSNLLETLDPALKAVRATNPTRPVIYGGENWSGIDSLATLPLPDDPNIYPTFHYYEPFDYTHQGASWVAPLVLEPGRRYGTQADKERLAADVAKVKAYIARTGKLPFMGETGAYDLHSPTQERATYHRAVREAFAPLGSASAPGAMPTPSRSGIAKRVAGCPACWRRWGLKAARPKRRNDRQPDRFSS
ncbi:glycoside hydrolase family 5 protein [Erythrobacter sp. JK5]|uniref:glycoside hydrolase family 5 protein n=1 Tax=Erythrobacter sp. JK5 TaxID=2829500 RepID=UPI0020132187|nr:glycoside hydrolase family 5 protein [Erythrobacter sp. JK5]